MKKKLRIQFILFFCFPLIIDRITKWFVIKHALLNYQITKFLTIDLAFNRGIAWSFFDCDHTCGFILISALIGAVITVVAGHTLQQWKKGCSIGAELLVLSGALSNMVDRCLYGGVADFIKIDLGFYIWPTFNIADICIVFGVLLMFFTSCKKQS